jgi:hypothetical protein
LPRGHAVSAFVDLGVRFSDRTVAVFAVGSAVIQTERKKEHRMTEEEMEGPTSSGGLRSRLTRLNLYELYDDDIKFLYHHIYSAR